MKKTLFTLSASLLMPLTAIHAAEVENLRCEYRINPLGIDAVKPRLSWVMEEMGQESGVRGLKQTAYQVLVASTPEILAKDQGDLWDSGKVETDQSVHVEYAGKPLASKASCHWKVRVWPALSGVEGDKAGKSSEWSEPAFWTMGLLDANVWVAKWIAYDNSDHSGNLLKTAQWIWFPEGSPAVSAPAGVRYFRRTLVLPADRKMVKATIHLTADNSFELYVNGTKAGQGAVWEVPVRIDITGLLKTGSNTLAVAATNGGEVPSPAGLIAALDVELSEGEPLVIRTDGEWKTHEARAEAWERPDFNDVPWAKVQVLGTNGMGPWGVSAGAADLTVSPWLRKSFDLPTAPSRAFVTVNIAGYAELYVNGQKVGADVLTPAISDHTKQVFYNTYDVSSLLKKGPNVIGLWLGRGWATRQDTNAGRVTPAVPHVRAQIDAEIDGKPWILGTDGSWKGRPSSNQRRGGMNWGDFGGERLDARADIPNWSSVECDDNDWENTVEVDAPKGEAVAQQAPLNRIGKEIPAVAVIDLGGGRVEIDFGTALTGWLRLTMPQLKPDAVVRMTFADKKMPNGTYQHFNQVSEFVSAGKPGEVFQHRFNYAGFRYVVVEGLPSVPSKEDAVAMLVESDLESAGAFECSNDLFNRISKVNQWTQRSLNLGGYYVDCPHRERLGYGDGQVAAEGFMTSFNAYSYYRKWMMDWRIRQAPDGSLPHVAPVGQGGGGPAWPGLLSAITWRHYLYYGDQRVLEENYDAIRRYADNLESRSKDGVLRAYGGQWDFIGDWVPPERGMDTKNWPGKPAAELFNNCYRIQQLEILKEMAVVLGKKDEIERCDARIETAKAAVHGAYYDKAAGNYGIDEQAYYVMPLMTGVAPESERAALLQKLEQNILVKNKGHLDTGMLGTYFMMEYLREIGRNDLVFAMFNQTAYPGWGYMLEQGATTLWEQWNGHWSHIHSCFTSPDNWFYQGLAGIQADPAMPGFKNTIIKPAIVGGLTWVKSHHDSTYGRIISNWKRDPSTSLGAGGKLTMDVTIPPNTTATIFVPAKDAASVTESGKPAAESGGVKFLRMEENAAVYEIGSGVYRFDSTLTGTNN